MALINSCFMEQRYIRTFKNHIQCICIAWVVKLCDSWSWHTKPWIDTFQWWSKEFRKYCCNHIWRNDYENFKTMYYQNTHYFCDIRYFLILYSSCNLIYCSNYILRHIGANVDGNWRWYHVRNSTKIIFHSGFHTTYIP